MDTPAATTPKFEALKGERRVRHTIITRTDCRDAFHRALFFQATKLLRLSRAQQTNPEYAAIPSSIALSHEGGESPRGHFVSSALASALHGLDEFPPFRMSRATRHFNRARGVCLDVPEMYRNNTADALLSGRKALQLDCAEETTQFEVTADFEKRPLRVDIVKTCRASFLFGPHFNLVTGLRFATTWNAEAYSPFSDLETLLEDVTRFRQHVIHHLSELTEQYVPKEGTGNLNPEIIESAFLTCKPPDRHSLTPPDIEAAMIRAGVANMGEPRESWFDLVRELDFDNTGFMEYNEFYLLCHRLTEDQLRRLTYVSVPARMKVGEQWLEVCLDFDAWTGGLSVYSDVHSFVKATTDRLKMKRVEGKVWDLSDIHKSVIYGNYHEEPIHTLIDNSGSHYNFLIEDTDVIAFYKMVNWIIYTTRFRNSRLLNSVDTKTLTQLAIAATHSFAS